MRRLIIKCAWAGRRFFGSWIRWGWFKLLQGSYFAHVGAGTKFYGGIRFGSVNGNIYIGRQCMFGNDIFFSASRGSQIRLADCCTLNTGCHLVAIKGIDIGRGTMIGEYVSIRDQNHGFEDPSRPMQQQGFTGREIVIGQDVWVGRGVFIGPGVKIGDGCVIGANSVVTHSLPPQSVAVGAPARVIKVRGDPKPPGETGNCPAKPPEQ